MRAPILQHLNQWADFLEIWYEYHAIGCHINLAFFSFSIISNNNTMDAGTSEVEVKVTPFNEY
jgi:hypothetical protein